jgi:hypothetical protein
MQLQPGDGSNFLYSIDGGIRTSNIHAILSGVEISISDANGCGSTLIVIQFHQIVLHGDGLDDGLNVTPNPGNFKLYHDR